MESYGQGYGYIAYKTKLNRDYINTSITFAEIGDRAHIYVNDTLQGIVYVNDAELKATINAKKGDTLTILVENMGRCNYGPVLTDKKGLSDVKLHWSYFTRNLFGWKSVSLDVTASQKLEFQPLPPTVYENPAFFKGVFTVDRIADTFIKPTGLSKGFILINGKNIGRYYNAAGPQKTLYVPACWLKEGENQIVIFDSDGASEIFAEFVDKPELG
jgi:beta-galactosidase